MSNILVLWVRISMQNFTMGRNISNYFAQQNQLQTGNQMARELPNSSGNLRSNTSVESEESSTASGASADALGPEAALIQLAQNAGSGLNSILTNAQNNSISTTYQNTLTTGHGIGLTESAMNTATAGYARSTMQDTAGKIGAMFGGPLGALAGRGIASLSSSKVQEATAYSPTGSFNPQSGSTPQSQSSRSPYDEEPSPVVNVDSAHSFGFSDSQTISNGNVVDHNVAPTPEESTSTSQISSSTGLNILV